MLLPWGNNWPSFFFMIGCEGRVRIMEVNK